MPREKANPEEVAKVLLDARERMNSGGKHWTQGILRRKNLNDEWLYCSLGAIYSAAARGPVRTAAIRALSDAVKAAGFVPPGIGTAVSHQVVTAYNDTYKRTWGDVSRMFRKAAQNVQKP